MKKALIAALASVAMLALGGTAHARAISGGSRAKDIRARLAELNEKLANLGSYHAQVKDLHVRVIRLKQLLDRLARAAEAPRTLARELDRLRQRVKELAKRVEAVRLEKVRVAYEGSERRSSGKVAAGYDGGFFVASKSGRYRLQVNGIARLVGRGGQVTGTSTMAPQGEIHELGMDLPNGILQMSGNVFTRRLTFLVELDFGGARGVALNDFALHLRTCKHFGVTVGQFQVGFARQQNADPYDTMFVDPSPATNAFGRGRDIGVKLHFFQCKDRVFEELGVFNGGGFNSGGNDDVSLMYVARVGIEPLGATSTLEGDLRRGARPFRMRLAAGYLFNPMPSGRDLDGKGGTDSIFLHQVAAELSFVVAGFSLNGEVFYRLEDHGDAVKELPEPERRLRPFLGGYAQTSYTFKRVWLQPTLRYTYVEPVAWWSGAEGAMSYGWTSPVGGAEDPSGGGSLVPESVHELTVGLNWHVLDQHLKLMINYTYLWERGYRLSTASGKQSRQVHLGSLLVQGRF